MIPVLMKTTELGEGWYRTYGASKTSSCRVYERLGDPTNPTPYPQKYCVSTYHIMGFKTSGSSGTQIFCKGTTDYDIILSKLKAMEP